MIEPHQQPSPFAELGYTGYETEIPNFVLTSGSLNGQFVKEGEDFLFWGFKNHVSITKEKGSQA